MGKESLGAGPPQVPAAACGAEINRRPPNIPPLGTSSLEALRRVAGPALADRKTSTHGQLFLGERRLTLRKSPRESLQHGSRVVSSLLSAPLPH